MENNQVSATAQTLEEGKSTNLLDENDLKKNETSIDTNQVDKKPEEGIEKVVYTLSELFKEGVSKFEYLVPPIFPKCGTAVLAGKPGIGKSQLMRQLCLEVVLGIKSFLNHEINPVHRQAIYVSTEDDKESISSSMEKQLQGLKEQPIDNLRFIFGDTMDQDEILLKIDEELSLLGADLVVVDSFGDIFKGSDSNNNMAMRNTVKAFDKIARKHNCLIVFVHHINKEGYNKAPGQEQIQGGSGLVQKVRLAIIINEGEGNIRYFTIVKANYSPKELRENSMELSFSEETLLFRNTGKYVKNDVLNARSKNTMSIVKNEIKNSEMENLACHLFENEILSYKDFCNKYITLTDKSMATAKRVHLDLVKREIIEKVEEGYSLKRKNDGDNTLEEVQKSEDQPSLFDSLDM